MPFRFVDVYIRAPVWYETEMAMWIKYAPDRALLRWRRSGLGVLEYIYMDLLVCEGMKTLYIVNLNGVNHYPEEDGAPAPFYTEYFTENCRQQPMFDEHFASIQRVLKQMTGMETMFYTPEHYKETRDAFQQYVVASLEALPEDVVRTILVENAGAPWMQYQHTATPEQWNLYRQQRMQGGEANDAYNFESVFSELNSSTQVIREKSQDPQGFYRITLGEAY